MVNKTEFKRGFSLVEIITATIVMGMMMLAVIGFVQSGSEMWRRGYSDISARNYQRTVFELLKHDMLHSISISDPLASTTAVLSSNRIAYTMNFEGADRAFEVEVQNGNLRRICSVSPQYDMRLARNVAGFRAARLSSWTIQIFLEIESEPDRNGNVTTLSSDTIILMAPRAG